MSWLSKRLVIVPTDMSEFSMKALNAATEMVESIDQLRVVHILPVLEPAEPGIVWTAIDDEARQDQSRELLLRFLEEHGFQDIQVAIRFGDPGTEIAYYAEEINAGLIVIPSHGRGMLKRMLLGSTTDRVVHLSPCPVLVLKHKDAVGS